MRIRPCVDDDLAFVQKQCGCVQSLLSCGCSAEFFAQRLLRSALTLHAAGPCLRPTDREVLVLSILDFSVVDVASPNQRGCLGPCVYHL